MKTPIPNCEDIREIVGCNVSKCIYQGATDYYADAYERSYSVWKIHKVDDDDTYESKVMD